MNKPLLSCGPSVDARGISMSRESVYTAKHFREAANRAFAAWNRLVVTEPGRIALVLANDGYYWCFGEDARQAATVTGGRCAGVWWDEGIIDALMIGVADMQRVSSRFAVDIYGEGTR
jgi:hypothetical protein